MYSKIDSDALNSLFDNKSVSDVDALLSEDADINAGEILREYLKRIFPVDDLGPIQLMDSIFRANKELSQTVYDSAINYLVRRLIKTAYYYRKQCQIIGGIDQDSYIVKLRQHLIEETSFDERQREKIITLLMLCTNYNNSTPSSKRIKTLINEALAAGTPCYICGSDYEVEDDLAEAFQDGNPVPVIPKKLKTPDAEHLWPRSLGGSNREFNLKVSCKKCNQGKESFIDGPDFHYEEMCYDFSDIFDESAKSAVTYKHKLALWAKHNFTCSMCGRSPTEVGPLKFKRINENDSWHYLNITAFCDEHYD